jgi:intraflagellar transport protein 88
VELSGSFSQESVNCLTAIKLEPKFHCLQNNKKTLSTNFITINSVHTKTTMSFASRNQYEDESDENEDMYNFGGNDDDSDSYYGNSTFLGGNQVGFGNPPPTSNMYGNAFVPPRTGSNPWAAPNDPYAMGEEIQRPMTSVNAKGYTSKQRDVLSENFGEFGKGRAPPLEKRADNSPEDMAREKERQVNQLLEESSYCTSVKDYQAALDKAKEAQKKERALCRFREEKNTQEQNLDLTFAILFNLARAYQVNSMYTEALDTYLSIAKNKNFPQSGRLRVNMGNIYFEQRKFSLAKQMYTMALDQIMPAHNAEMRHKIMKNIALCHIKTGKYDEAAEKLQEIVESSNADIEIAFNLVLCHYARGKKDDMKEAFRTLLEVKLPGLKQDEDLDDETNSILNDDLRNHLKNQYVLFINLRTIVDINSNNRQRKHYDLILKSAKLIAEVIDTNWERGYDYVIEQAKRFEHTRERCDIVNELEMTKALQYMKHKMFKQAIESLKAFEKKDRKLQAISATNLCYIFLLEGDLKSASKYANLAVQADKYSAPALVNKGNCYFLKKEYEDAKNMFLEALDNEADCIQAMYNFGLTTKELKEYDEALKTFKKLYSLIPESIEVIYQIASVYNRMGDDENAVKWYNMLSSRVPADPGVLYDLGSLYSKKNDESQAYNSYLESYKYYPINMDVVSWLGLYFVRHEIYEKALAYFERACQIQPNEVNWQLMVASCHRRIGNYQQAKKCYSQINTRYPENLECLRYLVQICTELGLKKEKKSYTKQLIELEDKERQKKAEKDDSTTPSMDDNDMIQQAIRQKEQQELENKRLMEQRLREEELERQKQAELMAQQQQMAATSSKPAKKSVGFAGVDDDERVPSKKAPVNEHVIRNDVDDDLFSGIDDGHIDLLYD